MRIATSAFQIWAILAAVTAGFSLINMIFFSLLSKMPPRMYRFAVFTSIVFATIFLNGAISATMIFIKPDAPYIGTFVDVAKATILVGIIIHLQTAISMWPSHVLAMSIVNLIVDIAGLIVLCYLTIKSGSLI